MAKRLVVMLRDDDAANQLLEMAEAWGGQCHKLGASSKDKSLEKLALTAVNLVMANLNRPIRRIVVAQLDDTAAGQLLFEARMRFNDELIAVFWFSKKLQDLTAFMRLTRFRIKQVLDGIDKAERYSMLQAKAAERSLKGDSVLGTLDLSLQSAAAMQEQDAVMSQVRAEMQVAMI